MGLLKIKLGGNSPQQNFSKSLLAKEISEQKVCDVIYNESSELNTSINTGFTKNEKPIIAPILPEYQNTHVISKNEESILDSIDTGFGKNNELLKDCPEAEYKVPLYKENFLKEFKSEEEKSNVRVAIGVYSKDETKEVINNILDNERSFVTKKEVSDIVADLDIVKSNPRAYANYEIPDKLFKL